MGIAYKLCKFKDINGERHYYPLYVNCKEEFIIGEKYVAEEGPRVDGKVKSKLGLLSYRPGIHMSDVPMADHIGKKQNGKLVRKNDTAWLLCYYPDKLDYTEEAKSNKKKCLDKIPEDGFYWFNTNAQAKANWLISGWIIPLREITDEEEKIICNKAGFEPQEKAV